MTFIESHVQGTLALEFPELRIEQQDAVNPIVYIGHGYISQKNGRALSLNMLVKAPVGRNPLHDIFELQALSRNAVPGQPFPPGNYFRVEGTDLQGNAWTSKDVLVVASGPHAMGYFEITAKIHRIKWVWSSEEMAAIPMVRVHIPLHLVVPYIPRRSDVRPPLPLSLNEDVVVFEHNGRYWAVEATNQWLVATVIAEGQTLLVEYANEICYALTFSFGQECRAAVIEHFGHRERTVHLISYQEVETPGHRQPPLNDRARPYAADFWRLFLRYVDAVEQERGAPWPSIVQAVMGAVRVNRASLEARALVLCVEIESLVKAKLMHLHQSHPDVVENLEKLDKILAESELPADFRRRVKGITGAMKSARAQDILQRLAQKGVLSEVEVRTWKSLRNVSTHGARTSSSLDTYLQQVHQVHSLLHKLIFLLIDYQGYFTDYGAHGWIERKFTSTLTQVMLLPPSAS